MAGAKRRGILLRYFEEFRARQATAIGRGATGAESWVTLLGSRDAPRPQPEVQAAQARSHSSRTFVTPRNMKRRKPIACLLSACRRKTCASRAGPNSAAGRRERRRSAYEAPRAAADGGTRLGGAESKRRWRPRLPAPPSRVTLLWQVAGEHEIVVLLLLVAGEALGGGICHRPLRLAVALERLEAPPARRLEAGAVLLHDADELAAALDPGAVLVLRFEEVEHEHAAVGERPALHERAHRLGVRVDVVQAAELGEERVLVGIDDHRLDERPLAVARRVGNRRLLGRGRVGGADEA